MISVNAFGAEKTVISPEDQKKIDVINLFYKGKMAGSTQKEQDFALALLDPGYVETITKKNEELRKKFNIEDPMIRLSNIVDSNYIYDFNIKGIFRNLVDVQTNQTKGIYNQIQRVRLKKIDGEWYISPKNPEGSFTMSTFYQDCSNSKCPSLPYSYYK